MLRRIFYLLYFRKFKYFSYRATIEGESKIEGYEYIEINDYVFVQSFSWLLALMQGGKEPILHIGKGTTIGRFSHIVALKKVVIGENVLMAEKVYISDNIHEYKDVTKPIMHQTIVHKGNVHIGDNSWIGESVSIIGVNIGRHCVIGANSVVTHDIPDYCVAVGNPAKVIKRYNFDINQWEMLK